MATVESENAQQESGVGKEEIVVRLENGQGGFNAYALNMDRLADSLGESYPAYMEIMPGILRPAIDGLIFALRHGILQRLLKDRHMPPMDKNAPDKNAEAVTLLMRVLYGSVLEKSRTAEGEPIPVDVTADDIKVAYGGLFRRVPHYDALEGAKLDLAAIEPAAEAEPAPTV